MFWRSVTSHKIHKECIGKKNIWQEIWYQLINHQMHFKKWINNVNNTMCCSANYFSDKYMYKYSKYSVILKILPEAIGHHLCPEKTRKYECKSWMDFINASKQCRYSSAALHERSTEATVVIEVRYVVIRVRLCWTQRRALAVRERHVK